MKFHNATQLDGNKLERMFLRHTSPYRHDKLVVRVRYSRGADFSGRCYYREGRILINLGRHNRYPFTFGTHVAKAQSNRTHWWREVYKLGVADAYQLALFIYLHELFHYLVKAAGRAVGRKEAMCDRFATRVLVDGYGCPLRGRDGSPARRAVWDFQDLHEFVAAAPKESAVARAARKAIPVTIGGVEGPGAAAASRQLVFGFLATPP